MHHLKSILASYVNQLSIDSYPRVLVSSSTSKYQCVHTLSLPANLFILYWLARDSSNVSVCLTAFQRKLTYNFVDYLKFIWHFIYIFALLFRLL